MKRNIQGEIIRNGQILHKFVLDSSNNWEFEYDELPGDTVRIYGDEPEIGTLTIERTTNPSTPEDFHGSFNKSYVVV